MGETRGCLSVKLVDNEPTLIVTYMYENIMVPMDKLTLLWLNDAIKNLKPYRKAIGIKLPERKGL